MSNKLTKIEPDKINFLKELKDGSVVFTCAKAEIEFPESFIDHKIAEIVGKDVKILGLIEIKIYDTEEDVESNNSRNVFFKHIGMIVTCPSSISDVRHKGVDDKFINYISPIKSPFDEEDVSQEDLLYDGYMRYFRDCIIESIGTSESTV